MTGNQRDQRNETASATTAQFLRWITLTIAMAALLLASSRSGELSLPTATGLPTTARSLGPN
jgi:hypothetical protein